MRHEENAMLHCQLKMKQGKVFLKLPGASLFIETTLTTLERCSQSVIG